MWQAPVKASLDQRAAQPSCFLIRLAAYLIIWRQH